LERKELMQAMLENLNEKGVKCELKYEKAINCLGEEVLEPEISLEKQNLDKVRLVGLESGGCGVPGDILRFQYEIYPGRELSSEEMKNINSYTSLIREDKLPDHFGGKVIGIKWAGQKLAEELNQDQEVTADLMRCVKNWSHLEFQIEAVSPSQVVITGPLFSEPGIIAEMYHSEVKEEIQCCAFGYNTMEKIAGHIKHISK